LGGQKTSKIRGDLGKLLTFSANVFETGEYRQDVNGFNKNYLSGVEQKICELWFINNKVIGAHVDPS